MKSILLVSAEGDPHGLLAPGVCGARPPVAWTVAYGGSGLEWHTSPLDDYEAGSRWALVLAWDGAPVPEGCDRAIRCLALAEGCPWEPSRVVFSNDLWHAAWCWRLVAFAPREPVGTRRWPSPIYVGKTVRFHNAHHVGGLAGETSYPKALATVYAARLGGEVVVLE